MRQKRISSGSSRVVQNFFRRRDLFRLNHSEIFARHHSRDADDFSFQFPVNKYNKHTKDVTIKSHT